MKNSKYQQYIYWAITATCVVIASLLVAFIINKFEQVRYMYQTIAGILTPIIYGVVFAFLLAPIYNHVREYVFSLSLKLLKKEKTAIRVSKFFATFCSLIILLFIVTSLIWMLIPQLISSLRGVINQMPDSFKTFHDYLGQLFPNNKGVEKTILNVYSAWSSNLTSWVSDDFMPNLNKYIAGFSSGIISFVHIILNIIIGIIFMMYILNIKETLAAQSKKICFSIFSLNLANEIIEESIYIKKVFSKFIVGKIIDSILLGIICFVVLMIFDFPYAFLISVIVGVTNVIPFFGPFVGAIPSAILILMISPIQCFWFLIIILILQQFDGNILGPKILGQSTGLSSFWVLFSILFFGGLFGVVGMIIGVPTCAVILRVIKRLAEESLEKRELSVNTKDYISLSRIDPSSKKYIKNKENEADK